MAGAFGFTSYPQRPSPDPRMIGQALMQRGQMATPASAMAPEVVAAPPETMTPEEQTTGLVEASAQRLRSMGAHHMSGAGQSHLGAPSAINQAVGEALTRLGGGYHTQPMAGRNVGEHLRQVQQLGLSPLEAHLMMTTGGL